MPMNLALNTVHHVTIRLLPAFISFCTSPHTSGPTQSHMVRSVHSCMHLLLLKVLACAHTCQCTVHVKHYPIIQQLRSKATWVDVHVEAAGASGFWPDHAC